MAIERSIDFSKTIPHFQWEEAYKNAGLSGDIVYEGGSYVTMKIDASREEILEAARRNSVLFYGEYDEITNTTTRLTATEMVQNPQSYCEMFALVNCQTGNISTYMRVDNPMILDDVVSFVHFEFNEDEKKAIYRTVDKGLKEANDKNRESGVDITAVEHEWDGRGGVDARYFNEHVKIAMSRISKNFKSLEEVRKNYDDIRVELATDEFYSNTRKEIEDLWRGYLRVVPDPDKNDAKELNKLIYDYLNEMGKDTCFDFRDLGWKAYKQVEHADRNFLITLKELGERLLASFRDAAKEFLEGALNVVKNVGNNVKQAKESITKLADNAREKLSVARENTSYWLSDRVAYLKERAAETKERVDNKTATVRSALAESGASFVGWIANRLNGVQIALAEKANDILDAPKHDFERLHNAEGFHSVDPNFTGIKSETNPFIQALGLRVDRDNEDNVTDIIYNPRLNERELAEVVSRSDAVINGKTLEEWRNEPDIKVEVTVDIPANGNVSTAMAFVMDKDGEVIGGANIDLYDNEIDQIEQVAKEIGGKAVLINDIANMIWGDSFNSNNANKWVPVLKKCSFEELYAITASLGAMRSQEAREGWAMGYLARTEPVKAIPKPEKKEKSVFER